MRPDVRRPRSLPTHRLLLLLTLCIAGLASTAATAARPLESLTAAPTVALPSLPETAIGSGVVEDDVPQLAARLLVGRHERTLRAGVLFDLAPGWHLYWRNAGGTGIAPDLGLSVPGHEVGEVDWPAPQTFVEADGLFTTWGYEGSVLLSAPLRPTTGSSGMIQADIDVLVCRTQCVPASFALASPVDPALPPGEQARVDDRFALALSRTPVAPAHTGVSVSARWRDAPPGLDDEGTLAVTVEPCTNDAPDCLRLATEGGGALFVPRDGERFEWSKATLRTSSENASATVVDVALTRLEAAPAAGERLRGLVPMRSAAGELLHVAIDVALDGTDTSNTTSDTTSDTATAQPTPAPEPDEAAAAVALAAANPPSAGPPSTGGASLGRWLQVLFLALLGGLILNGMPCVLPVLAIKVVAVADLAEKAPREVRRHGVAYGAGVLGSMAALAAVVIALRAAGHSVGWGFQFQEPLFVAAIAAVLVTFAMNLFGAFEIEFGQGRLATVGQDAEGWRRSFFEGLLAVVLATPCTAPFLGTAVGFAFASHGAGILAIFLAIGLGLASPFLLVSFRPSAARFIPRSGPWMNTLRAGLGFSLLATCVWLLWVLGQSGGVPAVVATAGMLLLLAFLLWTFGRLQPVRSVWLGRFAAVAIAAVAFTGFNLIGYDRVRNDAPDEGAVTAEDAAWSPWSEAAVAAVLAEGRPAFVVFTADWCLTCKMNEATVLDRASVIDAFRAADYALFEADWTQRDETIRLELAEYGRAGVPLYLVYSPDRPDAPRVLSELLSASEVLAAIDAATPRRSI